MNYNSIANLTSIGTGATLATQTEDIKPMIISIVVAIISELFKSWKLKRAQKKADKEYAKQVLNNTLNSNN